MVPSQTTKSTVKQKIDLVADCLKCYCFIALITCKNIK